MLALGRVRRTVDENEMRALKAKERVALRGNIERFDGPKAIPAASQRDDLRKILCAFWIVKKRVVD